MSLVMIGVTHRGTPLGLLERVTVRHGERGPLLAALRAAGCAETVVLSTCSRTEVYAVGEISAQRLLAVLAAHCGVAPGELQSVVESRTGLPVAEHLLQVAGGLASRVIGEVEIQGQVRAALLEAQAHASAGPVLTRLFSTALLCGRRVREETSLGAQGRSLARQAVEVGLAALPGTPNPVVVVVGAGRMAVVAVDHLVSAGRRPVVLARDACKAATIVASTSLRPISELVDVIRTADLVICATSAAHDVVTLEHVRTATAQRGDRPLTLVDLSVPRNVDAAVAALPGVRLIDLEALDDDASGNPALALALEAGAAVVASVLQRYASDVASAAAGPVIVAMRAAIQQRVSRELRESAEHVGIADELIARMAHSATGKLLHQPVLAARAAAAAGDQVALESLRAMFVGTADQRERLPCQDTGLQSLAS